jgi:tetratricopeptide (TPR) repeat protein
MDFFRGSLTRILVSAVVVVLLSAFGAIQLASDAFAASAAARASLPAHVPVAFGVAVYRALDRVAPAPYVESTLAAYALSQGRCGDALRYALRLPPSPARDALLARVAAARGDGELALEYFLAAPDVDAVQSAVRSLAIASPAAAYALERTLNARLSLMTTHPDAVAETAWGMGDLANRQAWREVSGTPAQMAWLRRGMRSMQTATDLAPFSEKYAIVAANQAVLLGNLDSASALFARAVAANPASADGIAGLGVVAHRRGDAAAARSDLDRARRIDPQALMVRALERELH